MSTAFGNILLNGVGDISAAGVLFGRDRSRFQVSPYFISVVSDLPDSGSVPWTSASSSTVVNPGPSWDVEVL